MGDLMVRSLYDKLGLARDANLMQIKNAYRKLSKSYHPDNKETGDEKMFVELKQAFETLSDPMKRAYYDQTGEIPGEQNHQATSDSRLQVINNLFNQTIQQILQAGMEPEFAEIVKTMETHARNAINQIEQQIKSNEKGLERLAKLAGRFKAPEGRPDYYTLLLQGQMGQITSVLRPLHAQKEGLVDALDYLSHSGFDPAKLDFPGGAGGGNHTQFIHINFGAPGTMI